MSTRYIWQQSIIFIIIIFIIVIIFYSNEVLKMYLTIKTLNEISTDNTIFKLQNETTHSSGWLICCDSTGDAGDAEGDRNGASNVGDVGSGGGCSSEDCSEYDEFVRPSHISVFSIVSSVVSSCGFSGRLPVGGGTNVFINGIENCMASAK
jgi:hypothetical protein